MKELKYTEILNANRQLGKELAGMPVYNVTVISNIVTNQLNSIFEHELRSNNIHALVTSGDYDNIVQDSEKFANSDALIIFWELANLVEGLHYKANVLDNKQCNAIVDKIIGEIGLVFKNLASTPVVLINKFSSLVFNGSNIRKDNLDDICDQLNAFLTGSLPPNFTLIDVDKIIAGLSIKTSVDLRYFYSSKALYSIDFFKAYTAFSSPVILSILGKSKKAVIFDCDNTLWKGIVGEDGVDGIEVSASSKGGAYFEEIHHLALALAKQGVLIGLCSKNNGADVEEVFTQRPDLGLKRDVISIVKVNWDDKASNLRAIASELNIGIDSLVFLDDSDFEVNLISDSIPEVTVIKVPEKLYDYPRLFRENMPLFYTHTRSAEDLRRAEMYKAASQRNAEQTAFTSLDDYLRSLELKLDIQINDRNMLPRIAQLTQKTNQFNLSTRRYTETEVNSMLNSESFKVFTFSLRDKFGDYGTTGLGIIKISGTTATIDTFLMSCRVIGRNVEMAFLNYIIKHLNKAGIRTVHGAYLKTPKNVQVECFYDSMGFQLVDASEQAKYYKLNIEEYQVKEIDHIT